MNKMLLFLILLLSMQMRAQYTIIHKSELQRLLVSPTDTIHLINFWATWCAPCVKELPVFDSLTQGRGLPPFKITLISLDFAKDSLKLKNFILKKNLRHNVLLLDEPDYNSWIDAVDPTWEGSIPATVMKYPSSKGKKFFQGSIDVGLIKKSL